jgi:hypothetical protein
MQTLDYQPTSPKRRKWLTAAILILIGVCGTAGAASAWLYASIRQARSVAIPARQDFGVEPVDIPEVHRWQKFEDLHACMLDHFVRSEGFGAMRLPEEAFWGGGRIAADGKLYRVRQVQLISLNGGHDPFAYVTAGEKSPLKNDLKGYKHRPVDSFEISALEGLGQGQEVLSSHTKDGMTMIGAVRATASCLQCHDVKEGDILGAFNYSLTLASSVQ